ncbi:ribonuclease Y [Bacteriovoracaceae bacterium]|nr:ribonuclease Y [Bacteriovoracaceae bacterium]
MDINIIIFSVVGLALGAGLMVVMNKINQGKKEEELRTKSDSIIKDANKRANDIKKSAKYDAKAIVNEMKDELQKEYDKKKKGISDLERGLTKKEFNLDQKIEEKDKELAKLKSKEEEVAKVKEDVERAKETYSIKQDEIVAKLTQVASMTQEQAKEILLAQIEEKTKVEAAKLIKRIEEEAQEDAEKKAKRVLSIAMQRFAGECVAEQTISSVELPNDEIKGRLIGREGRNIRAFEQICGVDLIIDDTPGMVTISSFNVVRKEIARMTIERLIADGRIHPAKIEEFHDKCRVEFDSTLKELGEKAQMEIGVHGMHPEVLKMVGALNWRTSYTQNQYQHALEAAFLCGAMAAELGLNVKQARRAGLLHDVGKAIDASAEASHAVIGADFLKKYGEAPDVIHAVRAHHEDVESESILAHLVNIADALSGARPGARKFLKESYVSRVTDIEKIANSFEGVLRSYAISAGREIRVIVENDKVDDASTVLLSKDIARKIEEEMSYPGSIKVSVLRETRAIGIAR